MLLSHTSVLDLLLTTLHSPVTTYSEKAEGGGSKGETPGLAPEHGGCAHLVAATREGGSEKSPNAGTGLGGGIKNK